MQKLERINSTSLLEIAKRAKSFSKLDKETLETLEALDKEIKDAEHNAHRTRYLRVNLTEADYIKLDTLARDRGQSLSRFVREKLLANLDE
jgi:hypothetical protein